MFWTIQLMLRRWNRNAFKSMSNVYNIAFFPKISFFTKKLYYTGAVARSCSVKKVFLEISKNSQGNTCARVSFLIKLPETCNLIKKEALAQVFSCKFCKISKNIFSYRTPLVAGSDHKSLAGLLRLWILNKHFMSFGLVSEMFHLS